MIPKSDKPNTLFTKDSYLDCSQIFYIHGNQLDELIKNHPKPEPIENISSNNAQQKTEEIEEIQEPLEDRSQN
ncbi:hypothetical protein DR083_03625 [Mycoplasma hyopneumoniae]|nr:hypothetical protein [Mesomycoplasma hyopneumoniae]MXR13242.1 hypothetical protein [Mesomycoplasma hyopneumoniae]